MRVNDTDPAGALPRWWIAGAALACIACMVLFTIALSMESIVLGFISILVLLLAATGLPIALRRHQARQSQAPENP